MVMSNEVHTLNAEAIEEIQDQGGLAPKRPVGVRECLGVSETQQVGSEAAIGRRKSRDDLAPHERGERTAVQQQQRRPQAFFVISHPSGVDVEKVLLGRKRI